MADIRYVIVSDLHFGAENSMLTALTRGSGSPAPTGVAAGPPPPRPLLAGRGLVGGAPAAYVCRQFTCLAPVTTPEQLRQALAAPS